MSIEKWVAFVVTPFITIGAGWLATTVGTLVPGVNLNPSDLTALGVAAALAAGAGSLKWLHGQAKFVQFQTDADKVEGWVKKAVASNVIVAPALDDIESVVKSHSDELAAALAKEIHAGPNVAEAVQQVFANLANQSAPAPVEPLRFDPAPASPTPGMPAPPAPAG